MLLLFLDGASVARGGRAHRVTRDLSELEEIIFRSL